MKTISGHLDDATTAPSPKIECWLPESGANGIGLVILPGGGYGCHAEHEGPGYAAHFSKQGIACFVVTYRLGPQGFRHPAMLEDALAAMATVRSHAGEFGVDPGRIGIMGSSAGGHLAAHALVAHGRYKSAVSVRPDFGVLCYPVITTQGEPTHGGSIANLLGERPSKALLEEVSCERHVSAATPPCFLWHTRNDASVPVRNSLLFADALCRHGVPFELHIYARGAHGLGLNTDYPWAAECLRWMRGVCLAQDAPGARR